MFNWEDESSHSQTIHNEQQAIIGKFETLRQQVQMYDTGLVPLEACDTLSTSTSLVFPLVIAELTSVKGQINDYKITLHPYEDHPRLEEIRRKLVALSKEVYDKIAVAQVVSKTTPESSTAEDIKPRTSKVKVSLPTFDGSSLDWRRFHDLFTAIIDKDPTLTDGEKSSLLINAMDNEEAKELVKASTLSTHLHGLNDCKALSGPCILAAQLEDQFGKELAHQWSLASEDSDTPPTIEQILEFVKS